MASMIYTSTFHKEHVQGRTLPLSQTLALFDVHKLILMLILDLEYGDVL